MGPASCWPFPTPAPGLLGVVDLSAQAVIYEVATVTYMVRFQGGGSFPLHLGPTGPRPLRVTLLLGFSFFNINLHAQKYHIPLFKSPVLPRLIPL